MSEFKEVVVNIKGKTHRQKEIEELAKKRNMTVEEIQDRLSKMYILEGAKYEDYI